MSDISKWFTFFTFLLVCSFGAIFIDAYQRGNNNDEGIKKFSVISRLPNSVLSTLYLEPRIREYKDKRYKLYNQMNEINYMDFSRK